MPLRADHIRRGLLIALLGVLLAACGTTGQTSQPTAAAPATAQPAPITKPTVGTAPAPAQRVPTAPATVQPAPTAHPHPQPIIGFDPKAGVPGTLVNVFGSGYVSGAPVKVRLGLPSPMGEVLASAFADADGRWSASLTIPDRLPSGEIIDTGKLYLVAMNDANIALASAPFGFTRPSEQPTMKGARQAVSDLLSAWTAGNMDAVSSLLSKEMRDQVAAGRPLFQVLGMQGDNLDSFEIREPMPSEIMLMLATLRYHSFDEDRFYYLVIEDGRWKIAGTNTAQRPQLAPAAGPMDAVSLLLQAMQQDRSLRNGLTIPYLGGSLRESVERGKMADANAILQEQRPFVSFRVDREIASEQDQVYVEAALVYGDGGEAGRIFTVSAREGGAWRIFKVTPTDVIGQPDAGSGWLPLVRGDFNQDGIEETVYVLPSTLTPQDHFADENLRTNAIVISQLVIEQPGAHGSWPMLTVDRLAITADKPLGSFTSDASPRSLDAFVLAFRPGADTIINLLPLKADGHAYTQAVALNWSQDANAYRIVGPHGTQ